MKDNLLIIGVWLALLLFLACAREPAPDYPDGAQACPGYNC